MEDWQELLEQWEAAADRDLRRAQGSIWTPDELAGWMAQWAASSKGRVLDPGAGAGALLAPLAEDHPLAAAEQDPALREILSARYPGIELWEDLWAIPDTERFSAIIANPPYISHAQIADKEELHLRLEALTGVRLMRSSNLALLFYLYCWHLLEDGGRMIFLMPTEFMQTKSGVPFKRFLTDEGSVRAIIDLHDEALFGDNVISTACLVLAEKGFKDNSISFSRHGATPPFPAWEKQIASGRILSREEIAVERRWRPEQRRAEQGSERQRLDAICQVRPGFVTGDNQYFIRSWPEVEEMGLESSALYCLIRPHALPTPYFHTDAQIEQLKATSQRRWALVIGDEPSTEEQAYLDLGEEWGVNDGPTQQARTPWWIQAPHQGADFAIGNFRRRDYTLMAYADDSLLIRPMPWAVVPNLVTLLPEHRSLTELLYAYLISAAGQEALRREERHAGSGLYTLRSGALKDVEVPLLQSTPEAWQAEMTGLLGELKLAVLGDEAGSVAAALKRLDRAAATLA